MFCLQEILHGLIDASRYNLLKNKIAQDQYSMYTFRRDMGEGYIKNTERSKPSTNSGVTPIELLPVISFGPFHLLQTAIALQSISKILIFVFASGVAIRRRPYTIQLSLALPALKMPYISQEMIQYL